MNGRVTPVSGKTRVTPAMMMKDCTPSSTVSPVASNRSNGMAVRSAMRRPAPIIST